MKILIASDHAGLDERKQLVDALIKMFPQDSFEDLGTHTKDSVHYPDFARKVCERVLADKTSDTKGILVCGTGIGMSIMANRFKGIRAALCKSPLEGQLATEHNLANVLCLGARTTSIPEMLNIVKAWREATFQGGRHAERIKMLDL
jgi:ribose 5-phosphate isomerase B